MLECITNITSINNLSKTHIIIIICCFLFVLMIIIYIVRINKKITSLSNLLIEKITEYEEIFKDILDNDNDDSDNHNKYTGNVNDNVERIEFMRRMNRMKNSMSGGNDSMFINPFYQTFCNPLSQTNSERDLNELNEIPSSNATNTFEINSSDINLLESELRDIINVSNVNDVGEVNAADINNVNENVNVENNNNNENNNEVNNVL